MGNWTASAWPILVSAALKSTLLLGAAWLFTVLLRGRSAAARHVVWTASAAALLALPLLSISLPALHLPFANTLLPADAGPVLFQANTMAASGAPIPAANQPQRATSKSAPSAVPTNWRSA